VEQAATQGGEHDKRDSGAEKGTPAATKGICFHRTPRSAYRERAVTEERGEAAQAATNKEHHGKNIHESTPLEE